jgi:hypothetical protein
MRTAIALLLVAVGSVSSGCSLCAPGYLCDYAGVGGKWQRTDPENGRVGSIFSDPNSVVGASSQSSSAEVIDGETYEYEEVVPSDDSIMETSSSEPVASEAGIVILGDQW